MRLLTPAEVAEMLSVSDKTLKGLDIKYVDLGRGKRVIRRYDMADVEAWVREAKCLSTEKKIARPTPMISATPVTDIVEIRARRRAAKQSASSATSKRG